MLDFLEKYLMEIITILAILFAPLIALRVSQRLDKDKELKKRQLDIFTTLMATRSAILSPEHVKALNAIDVEFYGNSKVIDAWRSYLDHLNYFNLEGGKKPEKEEEIKRWNERSQDLLVDLLTVMASSMNFNFKKTDIKRAHYRPQAYLDIESELTIIRKGLVQIFEDKKLFPIWAAIAPPLPPAPENKPIPDPGTKKIIEATVKQIMDQNSKK